MIRSFGLLTLSLLLLSTNSCSRASTMDTVKTTLSRDKQMLADQVEDQGGEHVHMPRLPLGYSSDRYINTNPRALTPESLKGKVVLIDIWDYTCVNCIRTLPYISDWARKYKALGLEIIGVHSPEFEFEKLPGNLDSAVKNFGLTYPVIADNEYEIWQSLANSYWPAKYLFDDKGILRASHFGEGEYQQFEAFIQKILLERDSTAVLPDLTPLVRETDVPGAVCYRPTPETYVGFARSHFGNEAQLKENTPVPYTLPEELERDKLYLKGRWTVRREYAQPADNTEATLAISYQAKEVNLVIRPLAEGTFKVRVEQNDKPLPKVDWGTDIIEENGQTFLKVSTPRMYNIVNNSTFSRFTLKLTSDSPNFGAYAFTFTTACAPTNQE